MAPRRAGVARLAALGLAALGLGPVACVAGVALTAGSTIGDSSGGGPVDPAAAEAAGIPHRAAVAYQRAATRCPGLDWALLAAVGAVESHHGAADGATLDPDTAETTTPIFGPLLDGGNGTAAIPIGEWTGWWGLTGPWTQAVGPMQFLPGTFQAHAVDADSDGATNPHDLDDATATAAAYLCATGDGAIDGPAEVAGIYNPGHPTYADRLTTEQARIHEAVARAQADHRAGRSGRGGIGASAAAGGDILCPVAGHVSFSDTFGAPRSGGRSHEGVDIFADAGTPVVAPEDGTVEHYDNNLGGLSYRLYADDGTYYYGTHLAAYENVGAGHITAGTVIGYVGRTGNAATTPPHLHWEIHPAGRGTPAINPTPAIEAACG